MRIPASGAAILRLIELLGLTLVFTSAFMVLALVSYSPGDAAQLDRGQLSFSACGGVKKSASRGGRGAPGLISADIACYHVGTMSKQTLLRLPKDACDALDALAEDLGWARSKVVAEALKFYQSERADLQLALDRLRDPNSKWIPHETVKRDLLGD